MIVTNLKHGFVGFSANYNHIGIVQSITAVLPFGADIDYAKKQALILSLLNQCPVTFKHTKYDKPVTVDGHAATSDYLKSIPN